MTHTRSFERSDEPESLRSRSSIRSYAYVRAPHWTRNQNAQSLYPAAQLRPGLPGGRSRDRNLCASRKTVRHRKSDPGVARARTDTTDIRVRALHWLRRAETLVVIKCAPSPIRHPASSADPRHSQPAGLGADASFWATRQHCVGVVLRRLVPRRLSLWGLVAAPLFLIASLSLLWTGDPNSTLANACFAPMALQEMVLAVWLIVKGFDAAALDSRSTIAKVA